MRPSRGLAARRKIAHHDATKNFLGRFSNERLSGDDYSELLAKLIAKGENPVMLSFPALATSRVRLAAADPAAGVVGRKTYLC